MLLFIVLFFFFGFLLLFCGGQRTRKYAELLIYQPYRRIIKHTFYRFFAIECTHFFFVLVQCVSNSRSLFLHNFLLILIANARHAVVCNSCYSFGTKKENLNRNVLRGPWRLE